MRPIKQLSIWQMSCIIFLLAICHKITSRASEWLKPIYYKTCVINDPLGQTQSLASSGHSFHLKFDLIARFWKLRTDGQLVRKRWSLPAVTVGRPSGSICQWTEEERKTWTNSLSTNVPDSTYVSLSKWFTLAKSRIFFIIGILKYIRLLKQN